MALHTNVILAMRIPWTEETGLVGSARAGPADALSTGSLARIFSSVRRDQFRKTIIPHFQEAVMQMSSRS